MVTSCRPLCRTPFGHHSLSGCSACVVTAPSAVVGKHVSSLPPALDHSRLPPKCKLAGCRTDTQTAVALSQHMPGAQLYMAMRAGCHDAASAWIVEKRSNETVRIFQAYCGGDTAQR